MLSKYGSLRTWFVAKIDDEVTPTNPESPNDFYKNKSDVRMLVLHYGVILFWNDGGMLLKEGAESQYDEVTKMYPNN